MARLHGQGNINLELKARIVEHYGTQKNFSRAANIDGALVSKFINNKRTPSEQVKKRMADLLMTEKDKLFRGNGDGGIKR